MGNFLSGEGCCLSCKASSLVPCKAPSPYKMVTVLEKANLKYVLPIDVF